MLLTDICPFTLGTGIYNEADKARPTMAAIIDRNSVLPCSKVRKFRTATDFQNVIRVDVYQGEEYYVTDNIYLGELDVDIPIALKGQEAITVRYTYDINGILLVDVKVDSTGKETQQIIMTGRDTIAPEEVDAYVKELEKLKMPPASQEEHQMLFAWGERLFAQSTGELREEIGRRLQYLQYLLKQEDLVSIKRGEKGLREFFESADRYLDMAELLWEQEQGDSWYQERMQEEEDSEEDYVRWYDGHLTS